MNAAGGARRAPAIAGRPGWLVAFVVVTFLAFPQLLGDVVLDGGLWLGPASVACLVLGIVGKPPGVALRRGFVAGWLGHAAILHWIFVVTVRYGDAPPAVGVLAVLALAVYPGLGVAAVAGALAAFERRGVAHPILVAALFTLGDHLRTFVATGFPWALLGYTQLDNPGLAPLAAVGGVHAVGFGAALGGALAAAAVRSVEAGRLLRGTTTAAVVWVALHGAGLVVGAGEPDARPRARVAAIQGNVEQGLKWSDEQFARTLGIYEDLTRAAVRDGAELVVWPETAVPGLVDADPRVARRLSTLARETGAALVVGGVGADVSPAGRIAAWYDSAFAIEPDGAFVARYDKSHLVPFGEYVPFRALLGGLFQAIARGVAALDVSAGPGPYPVRVYVPGRGTMRGGAIRLGVPICYELLFPDLVRRFVDAGSELLVAITNDAWYGRTGAPHQFLAITAMRSAETGVATVRAANTGVSAIIDASGRVRERSAIFERGYVIGDVAIGAAGGRATFYARHGDWLVLACWGGVAVAAIAAVARARRSRAAGDGAADEPGGGRLRAG